MSKQQATLSKQHSTFLPKTATMSNEFIVKYRPFDKVECCFDIVAVFGNNVERNFVLSTNLKQIVHVQFARALKTFLFLNSSDKYFHVQFVERIVRLVAFGI